MPLRGDRLVAKFRAGGRLVGLFEVRGAVPALSATARGSRGQGRCSRATPYVFQTRTVACRSRRYAANVCAAQQRAPYVATIRAQTVFRAESCHTTRSLECFVWRLTDVRFAAEVDMIVDTFLTASPALEPQRPKEIRPRPAGGRAALRYPRTCFSEDQGPSSGRRGRTATE